MRTASQLRQIARQRLDGKWGTSLAVSLLAALSSYGIRSVKLLKENKHR